MAKRAAVRKNYRIVKQPSGRWQGWAWDSAARKYRKKTFAERQLAEAWAMSTTSDFKTEVDRAESVPATEAVERYLWELQHPMDGVPLVAAHVANVTRILNRMINEAGVKDLRANDCRERAEDWVRSLKCSYRGEPTDRPAAPKTRRETVSTLRAFGRWVVTKPKFAVVRDPFAGMKAPKITPDDREPYAIATLRAIMDPKHRKHPGYLIAALALYGGLRAEDIAAADWSWVRWEDLWIVVPREVDKNGRTRIVRIMPELAEILEPMSKDAGPLVANVAWTGRKTDRAAEHVRDLLKVAGHPRKGRVVHDLRHACGSLMSATRATGPEILEQLGDSTTEMLKRYTSMARWYRPRVEAEKWPQGQICLRHPPKKAAVSA